MSIMVEHGKRQTKILKKALDVFIEDGFEGATFQKIAERCGITRTTLYLYFKNKREIFNYSIKQFLLKIEKDIQLIRSDTSRGSIEKITDVLMEIFKLLEGNRRLLTVVLNYLLHLSKNNGDPEQRVRRRTIKLRHILASIMIEGVKSGELKPVQINTAYDYLYSFIEAAIFRLVILQKKRVGDLRKTTAFAVKQLAA